MAIYSGFSHKKMVIVHSYVKLPEGRWLLLITCHCHWFNLLVPSRPHPLEISLILNTPRNHGKKFLKVGDEIAYREHKKGCLIRAVGFYPVIPSLYPIMSHSLVHVVGSLVDVGCIFH